MDAWIEEAAAQFPGEVARRWAAQHAKLADRRSLQALLGAVLQSIRTDLNRASRLATVALELAALSDDPATLALARRASASARYANSDYSGAVTDYRVSLQIFQDLGDEMETGKTLNSGMQALAYLGEYDEALAWSGRARQIFSQCGDHVRLARLASNIANVYFRLDRHEEAILQYEEALGVLRLHGEPSDIAATLSNIATCSISLGRFSAAEAAYEEARKLCAEFGFNLLVAEADYNIAWLYYLRGDYLSAMEFYARSRIHCREAGDAYHLALCDLDEAEMYLELNLTAEGGELASRAAAAFAALGLPYEQGKALVSQALASGRAHRPRQAAALFSQARRLFAAADNQVCLALIDLHEAVFARRRGAFGLGLRLCRRAWKTLATGYLPAKAALCEIIEAHILLDKQETVQARDLAASALDRLTNSESRAQRFQVWALLAQIEESGGNQEQSLRFWEEARSEMELLRNRVWGEVSRISFLEDKLAVYEALAGHYLALGRHEQAFAIIEQAKSRSMAELLALPDSVAIDPELSALLGDLNAEYRRVELATLSGASAGRVVVQTRAKEREQEITRKFTSLSMVAGSTATQVADVRKAIPAGTLLLEYYEIRGVLQAGLVSRQGVEFLPVSALAPLRQTLRLFQLQISRIRAAGSRGPQLAESGAVATERHLSELYNSLIGPLEARLAGYKHLVVIPHGPLHEVPFHALACHGGYLSDRLTVSYAPSAGVYLQCLSRHHRTAGPPVVFGIPDRNAPWIETEARAVSACLPESLLFLGEQATLAALREHGTSSRWLHIATHSLIRRDNPMFSAIRLGDSRLSVLDLYNLHLQAEMVTLSGCSTGIHTVVGGDELLGLVRGLLYAGARTVVASLWDVNDESTTEFMRAFYGFAQTSLSRPDALRAAMKLVRESRPHPYYWAPFLLVGAP